MIIIGSIPVGLAGVFFKDAIEGTFTKNLYVISWSLIILALILLIAEKAANHRKDINKITFFDAIVVGFAQALSLIPGSSRSGTTITGALFVGFTRETAARFSFLLGIPAILASGGYEFYNSLEYINKDLLIDLAVSASVAGLFGYMTIDFLIKFLKKNTTLIFIIYRIVLGVLILFLLEAKLIQP